MYITSYVDGKKGVDTLDGFSDKALDYIEDIYEYYYEKTSDGNWWGDLEISSTFSEDSDSFDAVLSVDYRLDDPAEFGEYFYYDDLYSLTFDLNNDNKFNITENYFYENIDNGVDHFDGTSAFFDIYGSDEITSLNLKTGQYKNETLLQSNRDFYMDESEFEEGEFNSYLDQFAQTDNYGLIAGFNNYEKNELIIVENIDKENHSVLFEIDHEDSGNSYFDDLTENKFGTLNVIAGNSIWSYENDHKIQTAVENYELYSYKKNGDLNKVDLGTYETYREYGGENWYEKEVRDTSFFLWNDDDADTWLVKEYRNKIDGKGYSYYEGFVLDDDFNIENEADLTLTLQIDEELNNSKNISGAADNNGFHAGFIFSTTKAEYDYEQEIAKNIVNKIQEANSWGEINYKTYDWSKVDYDSLSDYETERIKWTKVDLKLALDSEDFRFDAIDWKEIKKKGGVNTKKAYKLLNDYNFDDDDDTINLKYLTSVKKIKAGGGNDSIKGNSRNNSFYGQDGNDTIKGYSGSDKLYGQEGDDYLSGGKSKDRLSGGDGNDELHGGTSADKLYGGAGDDKLYGDSSNDYLKGHAGEDILHGGTGKDYLRGGEDNDKLYGESSADRLYGEDGDDFLDGGSSADKLYGGAGNDELHGGTSADKLYGGTGNDKLYGGTSADKLYGQDGDDYLEGGSSKDRLSGGNGNDILKGGSSKDKLYGGNGNDELHGGTSADKLYGGAGNDNLYGDSSNDYLKGHAGEDHLYGGTGKDYLRGGDDDDDLFGESGNDKLKGEDGNDILVGGLGKDDLYGGKGNDVFKLTEGSGYDRIRDFKKGEDKVDIGLLDINEIGVFDSGKNLKVYLDKEKSDLLAVVYGYNLSDIELSDIIF